MPHVLFSPKGRISGTQFLISISIAMLVMVIIGFSLGAVPALNGPIILSICWTIQIWPLTCVLIRRLHDTGRSAIWLWLFAPQALIALISLAMGGYLPVATLWLMTALGIISNILCWGLIFFLVLKPGDTGDNHYGTAPHPIRDTTG